MHVLVTADTLSGVWTYTRELVTGLVSQPRLSRGNRDGMVLAVNGRPISARSLVYALEECYQGRLERGRHPVAVVFGNEETGLDPATLAACDEVWSIPGSGRVQSLNVAAAAAILIYLLTRA